MKEFRFSRAQQQIFETCQGSNHVAFVGGIGSGKTYALKHQAARYAKANPASAGIVCSAQPSDMSNMLYGVSGVLEHYGIEHSVFMANRSIHLYSHPANSGRIYFVSGQLPERIPPARASWVVGDDVDEWGDHTLAVLLSRLRAPIANGSLLSFKGRIKIPKMLCPFVVIPALENTFLTDEARARLKECSDE